MMAAIAALFAQGLANEGLRILAMKLFLRLLLIAVVPLVILLGFNLIIGQIVAFVVAKIDAVNPSGVVGYQLAGLGAYLYAELGLDIAIGAVVSAYATKFMFRAIPFLHL